MEVGDNFSQIPAFSVTGFLEVTNQILDYSFPIVQITGELANFKINQDKYIFFDLKEEAISLNCFMMKFKLQLPVEDGIQVQIIAKPNLTRFGKFSLTVEKIQPVGQGQLKKQRELLYQKLVQEGLFEQKYKKPLPDLPQKIGIISSVDAAGYKDFIKIINDRWSGLEIVVKNTTVQGGSAPQEIMQALDFFHQINDPPELIVIVRGGGSKEDLSCFDNEDLVRAIFKAQIPVATGIGHEIDTSFADLAADFRAATPSHLAQQIIPNKLSLKTKLDEQLEQLISDLNQVIAAQQSDLELKKQLLLQVTLDQFKQLKLGLAERTKLIEAFNPQLVLAKGYAIVRGELHQNSEIDIETNDKIIKATIKEIYDK